MSNVETPGPSKRYYVYTLSHPNGRIFYIGKGSGNRAQNHLSEARRGFCHCPKCRAIQAIWKERLEVKVAYIYETDDEKEAFTKEAWYINELTREYPLCNVQGTVYENRPLDPRSAVGMTLSEYQTHLGYYNLKKSEVRRLMHAYGRYKGEELEGLWRRARRMHLDQEAEDLVKQIEELNAATGVVWQHHMIFEKPGK